MRGGDIESRVKAGNEVNGAPHAFLGSWDVSNKARLTVHRYILDLTLM